MDLSSSEEARQRPRGDGKTKGQRGLPGALTKLAVDQKAAWAREAEEEAEADARAVGVPPPFCPPRNPGQRPLAQAEGIRRTSPSVIWQQAPAVRRLAVLAHVRRVLVAAALGL